MNPTRRRLPSDAEELQELLLRHGSRDCPPSRARARTIERIVAAGTIATAATATSVLSASLAPKGVVASSAKVTVFLASKWAMVGVVAATAVVGAETIVRERWTSTSISPQVTVSGANPNRRSSSSAPRELRGRGQTSGESALVPSRGDPPDEMPTSAPTASPLVADDGAKTPKEARTSPGRAPGATVRRGTNLDSEARESPGEQAAPRAPMLARDEVRVPTVASSLKRELELLDEARQDLHRHAPAAALAALTAYERAFPAGTLYVEAAALRVEALAGSGRDREAVALGRVFLAAHPESPLAQRIRVLLAPLDSTGGP